MVGPWARRQMARSHRVGDTGHDMTRVGERLWVGSTPDLSRCRRFALVVICDPGWRATVIPAGVRVLRVPLEDGQVDVALAARVERAAAVIAAQDGDDVLVTCRAGYNRACLLAARVLMMRGMRAADAIAEVRRWRGLAALCNDAFVAHLHRIEACVSA